MKYFIFHNNQVGGPYEPEDLRQLPSYSAESLVCPEGKKGTHMGDWQRAGMVPDLALSLARAGQLVGTGTGGVSSGPFSALAGEPTLKDLAALGTLQEKFTILESVVSQLQDEMRLKDGELNRLTGELEEKNHIIDGLAVKFADVENRIAAVADLRDKIDSTSAAGKNVESTVEGQRQSLDALNAEIARLKGELSALDALRAGVGQIETVKASVESVQAGKADAAELNNLKLGLAAVENSKASAAELEQVKERVAQIEPLIEPIKEGVKEGAKSLDELKTQLAGVEQLKNDIKDLALIRSEVEQIKQVKGDAAEIEKIKDELKTLSRPQEKPTEKPAEQPLPSAAPMSTFEKPAELAPPAPAPAFDLPKVEPASPVPMFDMPKVEPSPAPHDPLNIEQISLAHDPLKVESLSAPLPDIDKTMPDLPSVLPPAIAAIPQTPLPPPPPLTAPPITANAGKTPAAKPKRKLILMGAGALGAAVIAVLTLGVLSPKKKSKEPAPEPVSAPMPEPVAASSATSAQPMPAPAPAPVAPEPPRDQSQDALALVKGWAIPNSRAGTVGAQLEASHPSSGSLSPWMAEKIKDGDYQVNFYASKTRKGRAVSYEFEALLDDKRVTAKNEAAAALLSGASRISAVPKKRRKIKVRPKPALAPAPSEPNSDQALLDNLFGEKSGESSDEQAKPSAPKAPRAPAKRKTKPAPAPAEGAEPAENAPPADSIDDLLK